MTPRQALLSVLKEFDPGGWYQDPRVDGWLDRIKTAIEEDDGMNREPCDSEIWSWSYFRDQQVDPYWIRCTFLGHHDWHQDSNTGARWTDEDAA